MAEKASANPRKSWSPQNRVNPGILSDPSTRINSDHNQISIDAACVLADLTYSFLSPACESPGEEGFPTWLLVLSQISLVITTLFLIEIPLSLWAFGLKHLNPWGPVPHAGLHVFDALVILTTFTGEVVLRGKEREIAGLLIFLRLWRLVKLVGGEQLDGNDFVL